MPYDKGQAICFVAGKYAGKKGWLHLGKEGGEETIGVIVNLRKKGEKANYIWVSRMRLQEDTQATSYAEAVIQQYPGLEKKLVDCCRGFAKAKIGSDLQGFKKVIKNAMKEAIQRQDDKGSKAMYRKIKYRNNNAMIS